MEILFKGTMEFNENLFYHQVLGSRKLTAANNKKESPVKTFFMDLLVGLIAFAVFFVAMPAEEQAARIAQSAMIAVVFVMLVRQLTRKKRQPENGTVSEAADRRLAQRDLISSGREGETCSVSFMDDSFEMKSPGTVSEYKYEGISWICETSEYFLIFWTRNMVIPMAKECVGEDHVEEFRAFLEDKCKKTMIKAY